MLSKLSHMKKYDEKTTSALELLGKWHENRKSSPVKIGQNHSGFHQWHEDMIHAPAKHREEIIKSCVTSSIGYKSLHKPTKFFPGTPLDLKEIMKQGFIEQLKSSTSTNSLDVETIKNNVLEKCFLHMVNRDSNYYEILKQSGHNYCYEKLDDAKEVMDIYFDQISAKSSLIADEFNELRKRTNGSTLNLSGYSFGEYGSKQMQHVQTYLETNPKIKTLNFSDNIISETNAIKTLVQSINTIETINASKSKISTNEINFPAKFFTDGPKQYYSYEGQLKTLNLSNNRIKNPGVEYLGIMKHTLEEVDLSNNELSKSVSDKFRFLTNLKKLNIANNKVTDEGVQQLSDHKNLQWLDISNNCITQKGALQLAKKGHKGQQGEKGLEYLDISGVDISSSDKNIPSKTMHALFKNRTLLCLVYDESKVLEMHKDQLSAALERNYKIKEISETLSQGSRLSDTQMKFLYEGKTDNSSVIPGDALKIPENSLKILDNLITASSETARESWKDNSDIQQIISLAMCCTEKSRNSTTPRNVLMIMENLFAERQDRLNSSFRDAIASFDEDRALSLLEAGAEINHTNSKGSTPLGNFIGRRITQKQELTQEDKKVIEFLIENHADINLPNIREVTPLMEAERFGQEDWKQYLVSLGAKDSTDVKDDKHNEPSGSILDPNVSQVHEPQKVK